jgi:hypothetical protein
MNELVYQIDIAASHRQRLTLLAELNAALQQQPRHPQRHHIKSLLYHGDWYVRREVALMCDTYGISLNEAERRQFLYALQEFELLLPLAEGDATVRQWLFAGCKDAAPTFRLRLASALNRLAPFTADEQILRLYGRSEYLQLVELGHIAEWRDQVTELLRMGMQQPDNPDYHRRQCRMALIQLNALPESEKPEPKPRQKPATTKESAAVSRTLFARTPLEKFVLQLMEQGVLIDGQRCYPELQIAPATRRITYRNPGLQTWSKAERDRRIQPDPGNIWLKLDYVAMEPTLLLHFLVSRFYISLAELPEGDIYRAIQPDHRDAAKQWLNAVINGGGQKFYQKMNPLQQRLATAINELRHEVLSEALLKGSVTIIDAQALPLSPETENVAGKAMNRLIQGSASAVFNYAAVKVADELAQRRLPARVGFVLFDELWVMLPPALLPEVQPLVVSLMTSVNQHFGLLRKLQVRAKADTAAQVTMTDQPMAKPDSDDL